MHTYWEVIRVELRGTQKEYMASQLGYNPYKPYFIGEQGLNFPKAFIFSCYPHVCPLGGAVTIAFLYL